MLKRNRVIMNDSVTVAIAMQKLVPLDLKTRIFFPASFLSMKFSFILERYLGRDNEKELQALKFNYFLKETLNFH